MSAFAMFVLKDSFLASLVGRYMPLRRVFRLRADWVYGTLLVLLLFLFYFRLLSGQGMALSPESADTWLEYYPAEFTLAQHLQRGELPLWTPFLQSG